MLNHNEIIQIIKKWESVGILNQPPSKEPENRRTLSSHFSHKRGKGGQGVMSDFANREEVNIRLNIDDERFTEDGVTDLSRFPPFV